MSKSYPEELKQAEQLMYTAKYSKALEIIEDFEKIENLSEDDYLSSLVLKGMIFLRMWNMKEALPIGEKAHQLGKKLENKLGILDSLVIKALVQTVRGSEETYKIIEKAESLMKDITQIFQEELWKREASLNLAKAWINFVEGNYEQSLRYGEMSLDLAKKIGKRLDIATTLALIGIGLSALGDTEKAMEHIKEALDIFEEFQDNYNISFCLKFIGDVYWVGKGELVLGLKYYERSLAIKECPLWVKTLNIVSVGEINIQRGELDKALGYLKKASQLADDLGDYTVKGLVMASFGTFHRMQGNFDQAIDYFERYMYLGVELGYFSMSIMALRSLIIISIDEESMEEANRYMSKMEEIINREKKISFNPTRNLCKALILKARNRIGNQTDAERLLKQIIEGETLWFDTKTLALINLCEILLTELKMTNNPEIFDELNPFLARLAQIAQEQHSYSLLAEVSLLQGRLELIRLNLDLARQHLTSAQKIAHNHGLQLLAQKISQEHDSLLSELETWQTFKKTNASISERLKLATADDITERMLGKRAVQPPEIVEEIPILLVVMSQEGVPFFNHSFNKEWNFDDLFSSFMSAFNTFSSEIFSKSIDRIKIDENIILINPVESFLVCYVIKGQSYPALQKLNRFSDAIKWKPDIWDALNRAVQTSEVLELNNPSSLGEVVNEIFNQL